MQRAVAGNIADLFESIIEETYPYDLRYHGRDIVMKLKPPLPNLRYNKITYECIKKVDEFLTEEFSTSDSLEETQLRFIVQEGQCAKFQT